MPLTLVPTPIGNLEDITLRAIRVLREADLIACEDTRTSSILLRKYNITNKLTSFHVHNENEKLGFMLEKLREGKKIAVISDAGTPGISDPGWILLRRAIDEGLEVDVLPGPSAVLPAVLLSGLPPQPFVFIGFPPEKSRANFFEAFKNFPYTLCFYVSPHKIERTIAEMIQAFGDRQAALLRELTKVFQEAIRDKLSGLLARVREGVKGELVLIVEGFNANDTQDSTWQSEAQALLEAGESLRDITRELSNKYNVPKNEIKKYAIIFTTK